MDAMALRPPRPYAVPPPGMRCSTRPTARRRPWLQHALASHDRGRSGHARRARELSLRQQGDAVRGGARAPRVAPQRLVARGAGRAARASARTVGDVLRAWWRPFQQVDMDRDAQWGNYLCTFARLGDAADGETWFQRYFGSSDRDFQNALAEAMPHAPRDDVEAAFRYGRTLFCEVLLYRCGKMGASCRPRGYRDDDIERTLRFVGAGISGVSVETALEAAPNLPAPSALEALAQLLEGSGRCARSVTTWYSNPALSSSSSSKRDAGARAPRANARRPCPCARGRCP